MIVRVGTTFPLSFQWGANERQLVQSIQQQIQQHFPHSNNLLINSTWFGPQFDNNEYSKFRTLCRDKQFQNLFLLASVDPVCLTAEQIQQCKHTAGAENLYLLGNFETQYQFNFISTLLPQYFESYTQQQLMPATFSYSFLSYNRKPHSHRTTLVDLLEQHNLMHRGVVTLGNRHSLHEQPNAGNWGMSMELGIPHDIHSLGNISTWRQCFLNVVSETIADNIEPLFVTEKTWKPMIGLRPFVINGQTKIYQYLRDHGFKTFNHFWPQFDLENATDTAQLIVDLIKWLQTQDLVELYQCMLPDLLHNQTHFAKFAAEQTHKINHLFDD